MNFNDVAQTIVADNYLAVVLAETVSGQCHVLSVNKELNGICQSTCYEDHIQYLLKNAVIGEDQDMFLAALEFPKLLHAIKPDSGWQGLLFRTRCNGGTLSYIRAQARFLDGTRLQVLITYRDETVPFQQYFLDVHAFKLNQKGIRFLMGHMCENFLVANVQTGTSFLYTPGSGKVCAKDTFQEQMQWFAEHSISPAQRSAYMDYFSMPHLVKMLKENEGVSTSSWNLIYPDGSHDILVSLTLVSDPAAPNTEYILAVIQDITTLNKAQAQNNCDPVTGLYHQIYGKEEVVHYLQERHAEQGLLLLMDLDHFKAINDCYGHLAGDHAIKWMGQCISDIFTGSDVCCRWGGDEFMILIKNFTQADIPNKLERLRRTMRHYRYNSIQIPITISIGVSPIKRGMDFATLFHQADKAMYSAKRQGRNGLRWYR